MCDKCEKDIELEEESLQENEQPMELSSDERFIELSIEQEIIRMDKEIEIDTSKITKNSEFNKGVKEGLVLAGFYNSLVSCGISAKMAEELTINKQTGDSNRIIQESINANQVITSKNQAIQIENNPNQI